MSVVHHLSDDLLLEYASGSLAEGWSIAVASHLALCPSCRKRLALMEQAGGEMLRSISCDEVETDDAWSNMKARLGASDKTGMRISTPSPRAAPATSAVLPEPLRSYLGSDVDGLKWKPLGRGAYHIPIRVGDGETSVRLLRIPAGKPVPEHSHGGRELTLVLAGSFSDETGRFARGDIEDADETLEHQPIADEGEDCICLAVTDAPLKFRSWFVRMVQPVLGI
ncbi:ChrR family anti-sigma-E factor [Rhizobium sp. RU36D]|uniref:ChrR family anti-sigma-E factor n=1 Tax=Rhizobium sp. RU36D TaxID=1907415 RepID=UPI0009D7E38D|nr:ChrR family anti-sigma-E factor [Rhizobium sp. RU36D]SMC46467.1 anti-ECFsigma factor, ChrR [Rhizobium sp. RU36D]